MGSDRSGGGIEQEEARSEQQGVGIGGCRAESGSGDGSGDGSGGGDEGGT